jgi:hypothetical protein
MNYVDAKARFYLKKYTCKGTLRQVFNCLIPPSPHYNMYTMD